MPNFSKIQFVWERHRETERMKEWESYLESRSKIEIHASVAMNVFCGAEYVNRWESQDILIVG